MIIRTSLYKIYKDSRIFIFLTFLFMKTNLKKLVAGASVLGLVAINSIGSFVNAAMLDNATASLTIDASWENELVTVNVTWKDFSASNVNRVLIKDNAGTTVYTNTTVDTNANWSFTINSVDLETPSANVLVAMNSSTRYTISFETVNWDLWSAVLVNGTDNRITVSAKVDPVLKFGIETSSLTFANPLSTTISSSPATGLELGTNAINGVTVVATSTNWSLLDSVSWHKINGSANDALYSAEDYQFESTVSLSPDSTAWATITWLAATTVDDATMGTTNVKTVYSANAPQNYSTASYDTSFKLNSKIAESTPAWNYGDTITFTITGNF